MFQLSLPVDLTVKTVENLGNLSTGGSLELGQVLEGRLYSEPGFEPNFTADVLYGEDFLTVDPTGDNIARPGVSGLVAPDDGESPFQIQISGIQVGTSDVEEIINSNTPTGLAIPYGATYSGEQASQ
ncbi:MAG: hypothetical protein M1820_007544 [Bogoriella megaspora]|nr:MAG: hypothetical protein M1820_007544 [Bogoriella megaspora]